MQISNHLHQQLPTYLEVHRSLPKRRHLGKPKTERVDHDEGVVDGRGQIINQGKRNAIRCRECRR